MNRSLLLLLLIAALPAYAQFRVDSPLPYDMRPVLAMDWLSPDTTTVIGVGDAVIRSLPGDMFTGLEEYSDDTFDAVAVLNDSVGLATTNTGRVVGLDVKNKSVRQWPGLPGYGIRVMKCGRTAILRVDSIVVALDWNGYEFQNRNLEVTRGAVAHCAVTDSMFAISRPDSMLLWVNVMDGELLYSRKQHTAAVWLHPMNAKTVAVRVAEEHYYTTRFDRSGSYGASNSKGPERHIVGFTPTSDGRSAMSIWYGKNANDGRSQQATYHGVDPDIRVPDIGWGHQSIKDAEPYFTAGITLPMDGSFGARRYMLTGQRMTLGYVDTNMVMIPGYTPRRALENENWTFGHSEDGRFVALLSTSNELGEYLCWTMDGGQTWDADSCPRMNSIRQLVSSSSGDAYIRNIPEIMRITPPSMKSDTIWARRGRAFDMAVEADTIVVLSYDSVFVSKDRGRTWSFASLLPYNPAVEGQIVSVCYQDKGRIFISGAEGKMYVTTDWGATWTAVGRKSSWLPKPVSMLHASDGLWYAVEREYNGPYVICTWDGSGEGFIIRDTIGSSIRDTITGILVEDAENTLWMSTKLGFRKLDKATFDISSIEERKEWPRIEPLQQMAVWYAKEGKILTTYGHWMKLWERPGGVSVPETSDTAHTMIVYPNPASQGINIPAGHVTVRSMQGLEVSHSVNDRPSYMDLSTWPSGVYLLEHRSAHRRTIVPIMVIH